MAQLLTRSITARSTVVAPSFRGRVYRVLSYVASTATRATAARSRSHYCHSHYCRSHYCRSLYLLSLSTANRSAIALPQIAHALHSRDRRSLAPRMRRASPCAPFEVPPHVKATWQSLQQRSLAPRSARSTDAWPTLKLYRRSLTLPTHSGHSTAARSTVRLSLVALALLSRALSLHALPPL